MDPAILIEKEKFVQKIRAHLLTMKAMMAIIKAPFIEKINE